MSDVVEQLAGVLPAERVLAGREAADDYHHDECLTVPAVAPSVVVRPETTAEVADVLRYADAEGIPVTARGSGTGLSGAAAPGDTSILVSFERMNQVLEIDTENHIAVVQPGVSLDELDELTRAHGLVYPVYPG